ncbi:hypothetical protein ACLE20_13110 [Rhizobium sp. YIM 134829]
MRKQIVTLFRDVLALIVFQPLAREQTCHRVHRKNIRDCEQDLE